MSDITPISRLEIRRRLADKACQEQEILGRAYQRIAERTAEAARTPATKGDLAAHTREMRGWALVIVLLLLALLSP
jgi:hypothetical protein